MARLQQRTDLKTFLLPIRRKGETTDLYCLLSQNQVVEVLPDQPLYRIPFSPEHVQGLLVSAATALPVIDLDILCGSQAESADHYRQLIVVRTAEQDQETGEFLKIVVAMRTRALLERFSSAELTALPAEQEMGLDLPMSGLVHGYFKMQDKFLVVLDFNRIAAG